MATESLLYIRPRSLLPLLRRCNKRILIFSTDIDSSALPEYTLLISDKQILPRYFRFDAFHPSSDFPLELWVPSIPEFSFHRERKCASNVNLLTNVSHTYTLRVEIIRTL